jgi:hypothetical protein
VAHACFGRSGAVTRISKRSQHRVLTGLPSLAEEGGVAASGPVDVGFSGWTGYLLVGNPGGGTYVLEIATNGLLNTAEDELPAGRLVRVNKDGSRTTLASEGLAAPGGFVLGHGAAYITNNSILSDAGQVVKVAI